ncbi:MAG: hypothetical protein GF320_03420 [Armatimonadia bacterium]|nr:hypothetical protein [Armatimonadia bacterium]
MGASLVVILDDIVGDVDPNVLVFDRIRYPQQVQPDVIIIALSHGRGAYEHGARYQ